MIADRLLARLGRLGYAATAWSLVRIACVVAVSLVLVVARAGAATPES